MSNIIDGKLVSKEVREQIKKELEELNTNKKPTLAVIIVGENPASEIYVRNKAKACEEVGFGSKVVKLPENIPQGKLLMYIEELNAMNYVNGILVQLPLPAHIDEQTVLSRIDPNKDVDVFRADNMGNLLLGNSKLAPCTPSGIIQLLDHYNIPVEGKHCVIVGRSNIVGKPLALLMLQRNATVTVCHSKTQNLEEICKQADILVSAVGKKDFITPDFVKEGAVVIDVGINRNEEGKVCGDVSPLVKDKTSYITPVPGGVGPMTVTMLLKNTLESFKRQNNL